MDYINIGWQEQIDTMYNVASETGATEWDVIRHQMHKVFKYKYGFYVSFNYDPIPRQERDLFEEWLTEMIYYA